MNMKTQKVVAALSDVDLFNNLMYTRMDGWELVKDSMRQEKTAQGPTIHMCIVEKEMDRQITTPTISPTIKLPIPNKRKETTRIPLPPKPSDTRRMSDWSRDQIKCACPNCTR